ncbi:Putative addiction module component [Planctopirus ephydatiae]|uniref:Addiction module component n=1 Tax=Planctopirus ephydatiae TaxID=2528019 RepID=A0A518GRU0_9PLAN|nr:addiction module protein [Planctopirus ephydatiae]QDV31315.1 Putative addiction module component [Planctopirus ephydatiae]
MTTIDAILAAVRKLPVEEQGRLVSLIWDELPPEGWAVPSDAWVQESNRRSDELESGKTLTEDWHIVRARAKRAAGLSE